MNAWITRNGTLTLVPEDQTEEYALCRWYGQANEGLMDVDSSAVQIQIEMSGLTLGPQPCELRAVELQNDD